jgi:hypothetical protein
MAAIPLSRSDVTPGWLSEVLQANGLPNASVSAVAFEPLDSLTSTMHRIRVDYESRHPDLPATLIWKQSSTDPAVRVAFGHNAGSAYQREVAFYREVAPTIETRTPRCYLAEYDSSTDEHVLLLEDLETSHRAGVPLGISVAATRGVLRELAHLHAARWNAVERPEPPFSRDATLRFFDQHLAAGHAYLESAVGAATLGALDPFRDRYLDWQDRLAEGPVALVHTDTHAANVLVARRSGERPVIIDWQGWRTGSPMRDVGRCLARNLTIAQRRRHAPSLLKSYAEVLSGQGIEYPVHEALEHYRLGAGLEWTWAVTFTRQREYWPPPLSKAMPALIRRAAAAAMEGLGYVGPD